VPGLPSFGWLEWAQLPLARDIEGAGARRRTSAAETSESRCGGGGSLAGELELWQRPGVALVRRPGHSGQGGN
jgi:hypothetical protein